MVPGRAALYADLGSRAFGFRRRAVRAPVIGAEVELLPVDAETRAAVPVVGRDRPGTLALLRACAARLGWREEPSPYGAPQFRVADGGVLSYEPGGQIELSAPPLPSAGALLASLRATVLPLRAAAREEGIELLAVGIDPRNAVDAIPLQLPGERYARLTRFMEAVGTGGTRMMRQTAAFQASLDWGPRPLVTWRFLNAAAPYVTAVFANSPVYRGADTGERSFRARVWRELGGGRTGLFPCGSDPVGEYLEFALAAPAILPPFPEGSYRSFAEWCARGAATLADWRAHLTTLFPEVRPKGFVEVRSADAVEPEWYAAPLVLLAGCTYHEGAFREARALVGAPDAELLERAGRLGLREAHVAAVARDLFEVALRGAAALEPFFSPAVVEEARAFFDRYTRRGLSPADDVSPLAAPSADLVSAA